NVPWRSSLNACSSSDSVFITIGPYHATGSSIGLPDTSRNRIPSSPAWTPISSPRSKRTSDRLPAEVCSVVSRPSTGSVRTWTGCIAKRSRTCEDVRERVACAIDGDPFPLAGRDGDIHVDRIRRDAFHHALPAPEIARDDPDVRAVVVGRLGDVGRLDVLVARL